MKLVLTMVSFAIAQVVILDIGSMATESYNQAIRPPDRKYRARRRAAPIDDAIPTALVHRIEHTRSSVAEIFAYLCQQVVIILHSGIPAIPPFQSPLSSEPLFRHCIALYLLFPLYSAVIPTLDVSRAAAAATLQQNIDLT